MKQLANIFGIITLIALLAFGVTFWFPMGSYFGLAALCSSLVFVFTSILSPKQ